MKKLKIIGHRGAAGLAPENTIKAFEVALRHGVDFIECDARVTKDKVAIINHDPVVHGFDGSKLNIKDSNYQELKARKPDLITLPEALGYIAGKCKVYLEIKPKVDTGPIVDAIRHYPSKDNLILASFSQKILLSLHEDLPDIPKLVIEFGSGIRAGRRAKQLNTKMICLNHHVLWFGYIKMASRRFEIFTYTLNNPNKAKRWAKYGLVGVVTDYPDRF